MSVGYLFSSVLGHLPVLAVLITGFVLVAGRSARLSPRSVLFARLGLGALTLVTLTRIASTALFPMLYLRLDFSVSGFGLLFSGFGMVLSLVTAAGTGLLIAAVVTRSPEPGSAGEPPPFDGGQSYGGGGSPAESPNAG